MISSNNSLIQQHDDPCVELDGLPVPVETLLALIHARAEVARLGEREQLLSVLLASLNAALWAFDWQTQQIIYVSPGYERIFGRSAAALLADASEWRNSIYPDDLEFAAQSLAEVLDKGAVEDREYRILRADGQLRWLSDKCFLCPQEAGRPLIVVGIAEDITEKKQLESELQRLATIDVLTQTSNRRHFFECAQREFEYACEADTPLAFVLLDIDNFKQINDRHGHPMGDQVLQQIARCSGVLRQEDLFGRVGGEEFAMLFPGCGPTLALQIAERLQREVQRLRFSADGQVFGVSVSQGLTSLQATDTHLDKLFARADAAMYQAKRQGKNQIVLG